MKKSLIAFCSTIILTLGAFPLLNAQPVDSKITSVTVFTDRAEVTRTAHLELAAGVHTLHFENLPAQLDERSLRVDGTGAFKLLDIKARKTFFATTQDTRLAELESERDALALKIQQANNFTQQLKSRRALLDAITQRITTPPQKETQPVDTDPASWEKLLTFYSSELKQLDKDGLDTQELLKTLNSELNRVNNEIRQLNQFARQERKRVEVTVQAKEPTQATLELTYLTYGPSWQPRYELRAYPERGVVAVHYLATVRQNTSEDWNQVALKLSTAQPMVGGRAPELQPWRIREYRPAPIAPASPREKVSMMRTAVHDDAVMSAFSMDAEAAAAPMELSEAQVERGTTSATFAIQVPADIPADNSESTVTLAHRDFAAKFRHFSIPKLGERTYLQAQTTNDSEFPLLPGKAAVFLDNAFVASSQLDLTPSGKEFFLDLGIDSEVEVKRTEIIRQRDESGVWDKRERIRFSYTIEVINHKSTALNLIVKDQLPVSEDEKIEVELIEPKLKDDSSVTQSETGILTWELTVKPSEKVSLPLEFRVSYPRELKIQGL